MAEPEDMIMPMLRTIRDEMKTRFDGVDARLEKIEQRLAKIESAQHPFKHALTADTLMSKLVTGESEPRIEALEAEVAALKAKH